MVVDGGSIRVRRIAFHARYHLEIWCISWYFPITYSEPTEYDSAWALHAGVHHCFVDRSRSRRLFLQSNQVSCPGHGRLCLGLVHRGLQGQWSYWRKHRRSVGSNWRLHRCFLHRGSDQHVPLSSHLDVNCLYRGHGFHLGSRLFFTSGSQGILHLQSWVPERTFP